MGSNWRGDFLQMQKWLKQIDSYVSCNDFKNAKHIAKVLQYHLTFDVAYEEEHRIRLKKMCDKN